MNIEKKKSNIIIIVAVILLLIIVGRVVWVVKDDKNSLFNNKSESNNEVELKHTESTIVNSTGVYITDVSAVVDEVMPSIVAITSKTIISSGNFGPFYYGNREYMRITGDDNMKEVPPTLWELWYGDGNHSIALSNIEFHSACSFLFNYFFNSLM